MEEKERAATYGEIAVGMAFNPSNNSDVDVIKQKFADVIDILADLRHETTSDEQKRLCSIAITEAQTAQMWAVKARTFKF